MQHICSEEQHGVSRRLQHIFSEEQISVREVNVVSLVKRVLLTGQHDLLTGQHSVSKQDIITTRRKKTVPRNADTSFEMVEIGVVLLAPIRRFSKQPFSDRSSSQFTKGNNMMLPLIETYYVWSVLYVVS